MMESYFYFIHNNPISADSKYPDKLTKITKIKQSRWPTNYYFSNEEEAEGPYASLKELTLNSSIFAKIELQKDRQRVLKSSNIIEFEEFIFTGKEDHYSLLQMHALALITIGKITNSEVKGVHFYNPNNVRIIKKEGVAIGYWVDFEEIVVYIPNKYKNQEWHEKIVKKFNKYRKESIK